ncbi:hypothetical protein EPN54_05255 [bacterium]|nr:MAG: hypothetical protein EPN54_05255 [bacterium]
MNILLVFDKHIKLNSLCRLKRYDRVDLFPLTSDYKLIQQVKDTLESQGLASLVILNSPVLINEQVYYLRDRLSSWSAEIGRSKIKNRSLEDWLVLPWLNVSTWWFSYISEKNTLKTDFFFRIAQIRAVESLLVNKMYSACAVSLSDYGIRRAFESLGKNLNMRFVFLARSGLSIKEAVFNILGRLKLLELSSGIATLFRFYSRGCLLRQRLGDFKKRLPPEGSSLFVTYFPSFDKEAALKGVFKNKYFLPLQDKLEDKGKAICWVFIYVPMEGINFRSSISLTRDFIKNGENIFFLEEFISFSDVIKGLYLWALQVITSSFLFPAVRKKCISEPLSSWAAPLVKPLWRKSFSGRPGMEGILYAIIFNKLFKKVPGLKDCLYFSEMQAWEKALNSAKHNQRPALRTIGFQHTCVSRNYLSYFYDLEEITDRDGKGALPLPDILACNGELMSKLLADSGYKNLEIVEALRHLHLKKIISNPLPFKQKEPVLLVIGSIDAKESVSLLNFVYASFGRCCDKPAIWFKGHPAMPFEKAFKEARIDPSDTDYIIKEGNLAGFLGQASAILVASSAVSIEALAFGCEIIVPILSDVMLMNPLADFEGYCHKVSTPGELSSLMDKIGNGFKLHDYLYYKKFIERYWLLDPDLGRWMRLLG